MERRSFLIGASSVPAAAALNAKAETRFPWTVRVEHDRGLDLAGDCLLVAPCDGFDYDNTYQLAAGEIVSMQVTPKGIQINWGGGRTKYVTRNETGDLVMGIVVDRRSVSTGWRRKEYTYGGG